MSVMIRQCKDFLVCLRSQEEADVVSFKKSKRTKFVKNKSQGYQLILVTLMKVRT